MGRKGKKGTISRRQEVQRYMGGGCLIELSRIVICDVLDLFFSVCNVLEISLFAV